MTTTLDLIDARERALVALLKRTIDNARFRMRPGSIR